MVYGNDYVIDTEDEAEWDVVDTELERYFIPDLRDLIMGYLVVAHVEDPSEMSGLESESENDFEEPDIDWETEDETEDEPEDENLVSESDDDDEVPEPVCKRRRL